MFWLWLLLAIGPAELWKEHVQQLHHLDRTHDRVAITFSGTPGMGKTRLARYIERALCGVRISNDDVRAIIRNNDSELSVLYDYLPYCYERLDDETKNHLVILDASIDRYADEVQDWARRAGYRLVVIRLEVSRTIVEERLGRRTGDFLTPLDRWWSDYEHYTGPIDYRYPSATDEELADLTFELWKELGPSTLGCER